jgi:TonB family protein
MKNKPSSFHHIAVLSLASFLYASALQAQEAPNLPCDDIAQAALEEAKPDEVKSFSSFIPAKTKKRIDPRFPPLAARAGAEGWVQMSYVIDEDGRVKDPVIEDASGNKSFNKEAIKAIKKWRFEPALKNGAPTQQCHQSVQFDFILERNTCASDSFISSYQQFFAHIEANQVDKAEKIVSSLHDLENLNRYENAWLSNMDGIVAGKLQDDEREMSSIARAIASGGDGGSKHIKQVFDDEYFGYLHQRLLMLQGVNGLYGAALQTLEKIEALSNANALLPPLEKIIAGIKEHLSSQRNLLVELTLGDDGHYFHRLVRNQFAFVSIDGQLNTVEVRCDSHYESFTIASDHTWKIPKSWGQCQLLIKGNENTRFNLVELAST